MRRRLVPVNTTTVIVMDTWQAEGGHARYAYRLRVSTLTEKALMKEWGRWVWNQCVAESKRAYRLYRETGEKQTVGPAQLDKMLTGWRAEHSWLRKGASVPQQQVIRDFGKSRAKALTDIKDRIPQHRRAGMPRFKKKGHAAPTLAHTKRGFKGRDGVLRVAGGLDLHVVWSRDLPSEPSSVRVYRDNLGHWYASFGLRIHRAER